MNSINKTNNLVRGPGPLVRDSLVCIECGGGFIQIYTQGKSIGYIPKGDTELLERVKELVNVYGWSNADKRIRLDKTSWKVQHDVIRNKIMSL